jgi:hypothetical protein
MALIIHRQDYQRDKIQGSVDPPKEGITIHIVSSDISQYVNLYLPFVTRGIDLTKPLRRWKSEISWFV